MLWKLQYTTHRSFVLLGGSSWGISVLGAIIHQIVYIIHFYRFVWTCRNSTDARVVVLTPFNFSKWFTGWRVFPCDVIRIVTIMCHCKQRLSVLPHSGFQDCVEQVWSKWASLSSSSQEMACVLSPLSAIQLWGFHFGLLLCWGLFPPLFPFECVYSWRTVNSVK